MTEHSKPDYDKIYRLEVELGFASGSSQALEEPEGSPVSSAKVHRVRAKVALERIRSAAEG